MGFDAAYFDCDDMNELFVTAFNERRVIVTKIRKIASSNSVKVIYLKRDSLKGQFAELRGRLKIEGKRLFTRCADCNREVYDIKKESVAGLVPERVFRTQKRFFQCPACAKIFWRATHWDKAKEFLNEIRS